MLLPGILIGLADLTLATANFTRTLVCPPGYLARGQSVYAGDSGFAASSARFATCVVCRPDSAFEDEVEVCLDAGLFVGGGLRFGGGFADEIQSDGAHAHFDLPILIQLNSLFQGTLKAPRSQTFYVYRQEFTCEKKSHGFGVHASAADYYALDPRCGDRVCGARLDASVPALGYVLESASITNCPGDFVAPEEPPVFRRVGCPAGQTLGGVLHTHFWAEARYHGVSCALCYIGEDPTLVCKRNYVGEADYRSTYACAAPPCLEAVVGVFPLLRSSSNATPGGDCGFEFEPDAGPTLDLVASVRTIPCGNLTNASRSLRYGTPAAFTFDSLHAALAATAAAAVSSLATVVLYYRRRLRGGGGDFSLGISDASSTTSSDGGNGNGEANEYYGEEDGAAPAAGIGSAEWNKSFDVGGNNYYNV